MKAQLKTLQDHLHNTLTSLIGSGYTMKPARINGLAFFKDGQQVWFLPRFQMVNLTWGTIVGYLLWARSNGWDEAALNTSAIPVWLGVGQMLYDKSDVAEIRRLLSFAKRFPYWAQTDASREAQTELWFKFIRNKYDHSDHYLNILEDIHKDVPKKFTGVPYPVYNYATPRLTGDEHHEQFAAENGITVARSRELEAEVLAKIKKQQ